MKKILELLFPPRCPVCDRLLETKDIRCSSRIHNRCKTKLFPVMPPACFHCGRPLEEDEAEYCFDCTKRMRQRKPSYYVQGKAVFLYQGEIKKSIYRFKYSNRREYAAFFAEEAHRRFGDWIKACGIQAIVPVPMYRRKERRRGYNQAKLLAKELAALTGLCYEPNAVRRIRDTRPQKELNDTERQNNLKTAFQAQDFVVKYKKILLVDDIYTTGCTAETVAEELFQTGVEQVYFLSVCIGKGF